MTLVCLISIALHKWFEKPMVGLLRSAFDKKFEPAKAVVRNS